MSIKDMMFFLGSFTIASGIWRFIWLKIHRRGYELTKLENESFFDYLVRSYPKDLAWKLRKRMNLSWYYNSKLFPIFQRLTGVFLVLLGASLFICYFYFKGTEYGAILDVKL